MAGEEGRIKSNVEAGGCIHGEEWVSLIRPETRRARPCEEGELPTDPQIASSYSPNPLPSAPSPTPREHSIFNPPTMPKKNP